MEVGDCLESLTRLASRTPMAGLVLILSFCLALGWSGFGGKYVNGPSSYSSEVDKGGNLNFASYVIEASDGDSDIDNDGLIEVRYLEQLDAIRNDLNGDGDPDNNDVSDAYYEAFSRSALEGACPEGCQGYELDGDLDFKDSESYASGTVNTEWTSGKGWVPIGTEDSPFVAMLEGNGQVISNLFILRPDYEEEYSRGVGLFGHTGSTSTFRGIGLTEVDVIGATWVGGLVGYNQGRIERCHVSGNVNGSDEVGGLVGENRSYIRESRSSARVLGWSHIGSLVGAHYGDLLFSNATGGASGRYSTGGLIGFSDGVVVHSSASGNVACYDSDCGGLIGRSLGYTINSSATGDVTGSVNVGGLNGTNGGPVMMSYSIGRVAGSSSVGGLIGWNDDRVTASYATGAVTGRGQYYSALFGKESVGGLVGRNSGELVAVYALGDVSGGINVGGLVGSSEEGMVRAVYSAGHVKGESVVGGLVGKNAPRWEGDEVVLQDGVWDVHTSGRLEGVGEGDPAINGVGVTSSELRAASSYTGLFANWRVDVDNVDGDDDYDTGVDDVWDFGISDQYPALKVDLNGDDIPTWQEFGPQGRIPQTREDNGKYDVDQDGLIEISDIEQLAAMALDFSGHGRPNSREVRKPYYRAYPVGEGEEVCKICYGYELTRSLDFADANSYSTGLVHEEWGTGQGWLPATLGSFESPSVFEGNGHAVSNLRYSGSTEHPYFDAAGLFGVVEENSEIRNVGVLNVSIEGGYNAGGLAGRNEGQILNSYTTGRVIGKDNVGGLVGANYRTIRFSHASVKISGGTAVGGLAGLSKAGSRGQEASIASSYATGDVTGIVEVGGLVGRNAEAQITSTYALGNVTGESRVGGLVGVNAINFYPAKVTASYAAGNVAGSSVVGGLAGANSDSITASYATGQVSGDTAVGGLVGDNSMPYVDRWDEGGPGTVIASYATGRVTGGSAVGGLAGRNPGKIVLSYWDTETTRQYNGAGEGNPTGETGKATALLQSPTGFDEVFTIWDIDLDNADGDFTLETGAGDFWDFGTVEQYPALKADLDGDGIATWQEFGNQGRDPSSAVTVPSMGSPTPTPTPIPALDDGANLDADADGLIDVSNLEELNAVRYDLDGDGVPDGSGAAIYASAFPSYIVNPCEECNGYELTRSLDFQDPDSYFSGIPNPLWLSGSGWLPIGIVEGENWFNAIFEGNEYTIRNLYINRTTTLEDLDAAGLFGYAGPSSVIRNLGLIDVDVSGLRSAASLVGENWGIIRNSYAIGIVSGTTHSGGLVGFNWRWNDPNNKWQIVSSYANVDVTGTDYVGGLIGMHYGTVHTSFASGNIVGDEVVGGLIGGNISTLSSSYAVSQVSGRGAIGGLVGYNSGTIDSSYAGSHVLGEEEVGGLVGYNEYDILASYSTGSVTGNRHVGGLVGWNGGIESPAAIINCYTTALVIGDEPVGGFVGVNRSAIIDSYWDVEATGQSEGAGENDPSNEAHFPRRWWDGQVQITGKTTVELQENTGYSSIYENWGRSAEDVGLYWHEDTRDLSDVWDFGNSSQYPSLKADFDRDGAATWQEFGSQGRNLPPSEPAPVPTPQPTPSPEPTSTPKPMPTPDPKLTVTATPIPTLAPTALATPAVIPVPTSADEPAPEAISAATSTPGPSPERTVAPERTSTPERTTIPEPDAPATTEQAGLPTWLVALIVAGCFLAIVGVVAYTFLRIR